MLPTITHVEYLKAPVVPAGRGGAGIAVILVALAIFVAIAAAWTTSDIPGRGVAARPGPTSGPLTAQGHVPERATARLPH